jgi:hypothetical protein
MWFHSPFHSPLRGQAISSMVNPSQVSSHFLWMGISAGYPTVNTEGHKITAWNKIGDRSEI